MKHMKVTCSKTRNHYGNVQHSYSPLNPPVESLFLCLCVCFVFALQESRTEFLDRSFKGLHLQSRFSEFKKNHEWWTVNVPHAAACLWEHLQACCVLVEDRHDCLPRQIRPLSSTTNHWPAEQWWPRSHHTATRELLGKQKAGESQVFTPVFMF